MMFHQVTVKDKVGKVKKVFTSKQLGRRHWRNFKIDLEPLGSKTKKTFIPISQYDYDYEDYEFHSV